MLVFNELIKENDAQRWRSRVVFLSMFVPMDGWMVG